MWRLFWWCAAVVGILSTFLIWSSANATFLFSHPRTKGVRVEIDKQTGAAVVMAKAASSEPAAPVTSAGKPRIDLPEEEFDFGVMDPLTMGRHDFIVKNAGQAPLQLSVGSTTCKCTIGGLDKSSVPPGDQAVVTIEWNTGKDSHYSHGATILSNDPQQKKFELWVTGKVRVSIAAETPEFSVGQIVPGEAKTAEILLYSQLWNSFTVENLEFQTPGLKWEVEPLEASAAAALQATAAAKLRVTVPQDLKTGEFSDPLRLSIAPPGENAKTQHLDLPLHGQVLGRVSYYGPDISNDAVVLGAVPFGVAKKTKLLVKIRDPEPNLGELKFEVYPETLQVRLVPHASDSAKGLHELHIELPAGAPPGAYLSSPQGYVRVITSHPRVPKIEIPVRFAVLEKAAL